MAHQGHPVNVYTLPEFPTGGHEVVTGVDPTKLNHPWDVCMLGFITADILGVKVRGALAGREMVTLVRDYNSFWSNRYVIKVFNGMNVEVGYLDERASVVLARLMDAGLVWVEAIIPNYSMKADAKWRPVQIYVFAIREKVDEVYAKIIWGGLEIIRTEGSVEIVEMARQDEHDQRRLNGIARVVSDGAVVEVVETPREVVKTELFLHQKKALAWMVKTESWAGMPPFWVEQCDGSFVNEVMNVGVAHRPRALRGGILGDDSGMGKTLTLLSLIASDKCSYGGGSGSGSGSDVVEDGKEEFAIYQGKEPKRARGSRVVDKMRKRQRVVGELSNDGNALIDLVASRTTLVVSSTSVFSTWKEQLKKHTKPGKFSVYLYYKQRTKDPMELIKYDLVLTTYSLLASELESGSPVFQVPWWRVILDEAHLIKHSTPTQASAVLRLNARRRWLVTGTPLQNTTMDMYSFMSFLKYNPFTDKHSWKKTLLKPVDTSSEVTRLQAVMEAICLRRTKEQNILGLPRKIMKICSVDLSAEERQLYDQMEVEAKTAVQDYISSGTVRSHYIAVLGIVLRLRQTCTHMDLCPKVHIATLPCSNKEELSNNPELLKKMAAILDGSEELECPICLSAPNNIVITRCAHIYCQSCILRTLKRDRPRCPLCRHDLSESDIFSAPTEQSNAEIASSGESSRITALLKLLSEARDQDPTAKSVVFSQFRKMLILLEEPLKTAGFNVLRLDGSMIATKRAQVIKDFGVAAPNGRPTVLLASLRASSTGVDLAAANRVYLLEPWWNPEVDDQAINRVHLTGQTKDVTVVRIVARNSIEERILALQDQKRMAGPAVYKLNINDIRTLLSL
uniref:Uncharacterized protein n=1 Tax=Daucus carota subsp. sativus TaxID=79200 RepID=A0A165ZSP2_DAUCS|nr:PREDICTED: putative SWI/SNF-related matrix-associated actin-dependent regulator of chromatin subfamily A member 3-like 1 [Daucus carota subsp. sativus]